MPFKNNAVAAAYMKVWRRVGPDRLRLSAEHRIECTIIGQTYVNGYLRSHPCVDCGNNDIRVLQFDHVRGTKSRNVGAIAAAGNSIDRIKEEIAKCDVRCANCHKIRHGKGWRDL